MRDRQTNRERETETETETERERERKRQRQTERQTERQRQTDRQTDRQTEAERSCSTPKSVIIQEPCEQADGSGLSRSVLLDGLSLQPFSTVGQFCRHCDVVAHNC